MLFSLQNTIPESTHPTSCKVTFCSVQQFCKENGQSKCLKNRTKLSALGEDSLGNPFQGSANAISLKLLSEIYVSSGSFSSFWLLNIPFL